MSIAITPLWVHNFQLAVAAGDYRAARCILDNQRVGLPTLNWQRYVTAEQAATIEATHVPIVIQSIPSLPKPTPKRRKAG